MDRSSEPYMVLQTVVTNNQRKGGYAKALTKSAIQSALLEQKVPSAAFSRSSCCSRVSTWHQCRLSVLHTAVLQAGMQVPRAAAGCG